MIRCALYDPDSNELKTGNESLLDEWTINKNKLIWLDFELHDKQAEREILEKYFFINTLAIDDAQRERHPPKVEWFDDYFFLLIKAFNLQTDSIEFGILHISFFVGNNFFITRHDGTSPSVNKIWDQYIADDSHILKDPQYICYKVLRMITNRYMPIILGIESNLDNIEESMLVDPSDELLRKLISYNGKLKKLRRIFGYQEAVLAEILSNQDFINSERKHEYQDVHEQMERLSSLSTLYHEITRDLIEGYISVTTHRLNQIMKILTVMTVIFLPLTFIAGIYGMNFEYMPELKNRNAYFIVIGIMTSLAIFMVYLFRKIKWL